MEFMIQWFWILKLLVSLSLIVVVYKLYKSKWKSKFWWSMLIIGLLLLIVSPVKLDTNTRSKQLQTNEAISSSKALPPMIEDHSFRDSRKDLGITEKDLP